MVFTAKTSLPVERYRTVRSYPARTRCRVKPGQSYRGRTQETAGAERAQARLTGGRNTHKSYSFERETKIDAKLVTGAESDRKIDEIEGT